MSIAPKPRLYRFTLIINNINALPKPGPVPMVLDLRIAHDRVGSSTDPTLNGHLRYPNNLNKSLNDAVTVKYENIALTTTTIHRVWCHLCLLLLVRLGGYITSLSDFYSYVDCSTSAARHTLLSLSQNVEIFSLRLHLHVLILTQTGCLSHLNLTLTPHTRKLLVC